VFLAVSSISNELLCLLEPFSQRGVSLAGIGTPTVTRSIWPPMVSGIGSFKLMLHEAVVGECLGRESCRNAFPAAVRGQSAGNRGGFAYYLFATRRQ